MKGGVAMSSSGEISALFSILALMAVAALAVLALTGLDSVDLPRVSEPCTHAVERHGTEALDIHERFQRRSYDCLWVFRRETGSLLWLMGFAEDPRHLAGIITRSDGTSVTAFWSSVHYWRRVIVRDQYTLVTLSANERCPEALWPLERAAP